MVITLPKLNAVGKVKETQIFTAAVKGWEKTTILYKGKTFDGVKVYTSEGQFKVFASPVEFTTKLAFAKSSGQAVNVLPAVKVPGYVMLDVASVNKQLLALQAGQ